MAEIISIADLPENLQGAELIEVMVAGANARATRVAPCLSSVDPAPSPEQLAEAKLVLIGAIKRWSQAGAGALQQQQAGPFGMTFDTRERTGYNLWPSEIADLQEICKDAAATSGPFSIDTAPTVSAHRPWCSLAFGAYCSCGADIAGYPIYES